jgi:hypothetical protein
LPEAYTAPATQIDRREDEHVATCESKRLLAE